ncbi:pentatricopeptide repeat-containing protein At2g34400 [Aristolochia californica]|uniref:pentatricopeptide repeat-containing protein At2g34400 n=1 Tax=Aristolochia californica TaxID=171875 RepID=UPI0035D75F66
MLKRRPLKKCKVLSSVHYRPYSSLGSYSCPVIYTNLANKLLTLLKGCSSLQSFKQIHSQMITFSVQIHNHLLCKLVELQNLPYAALLFTHIPRHGDFSYNIMIRALTNTWQQFDAAIELYYQMKFSSIRPNNFTYPFLLIACGNTNSTTCGKVAHSSIFKTGLDTDLHVCHSLITFYAKCDQMDFAKSVFDEIGERDVVSWNSLISGYSRLGLARESVGSFRKMRMAGFEPNEMTLVSVLGSCGDLGDLELGKWIERFMEENGMKMNSYIGSSLLNMYGKCGDLESARRVFDRMSKREVITWNAMITGYAQNGMSEEAVKLFHLMKEEGATPDKITMVGVLSACAALAALDLGIWVDEFASQKGLRYDIYVGTALIDMYAKCGNLERALSLFEEMPTRNVVCWNAMIMALAVHGRAYEAISLFTRLIEENHLISPNDVTFVGVLSACVHVGLVEEGHRWFNAMVSTFGIVPKMEHYSCMVDLLARAGYLNEAYEFIETMPEKPDAVTFGALLCACRNHKNVEVGERVMNKLLELEPSNSGNYVISSKLYASSKRWDDSARMRGLMRARGVTKTPGCSWIEMDHQVHEFRAGDDLQNGSREISEVIGLLYEDMKLHGYIPKIDIE